MSVLAPSSVHNWTEDLQQTIEYYLKTGNFGSPVDIRIQQALNGVSLPDAFACPPELKFPNFRTSLSQDSIRKVIAEQRDIVLVVEKSADALFALYHECQNWQQKQLRVLVLFMDDIEKSQLDPNIFIAHYSGSFFEAPSKTFTGIIGTTNNQIAFSQKDDGYRLRQNNTEILSLAEKSAINKFRQKTIPQSLKVSDSTSILCGALGILSSTRKIDEVSGSFIEASLRILNTNMKSAPVWIQSVKSSLGKEVENFYLLKQIAEVVAYAVIAGESAKVVSFFNETNLERSKILFNALRDMTVTLQTDAMPSPTIVCSLNELHHQMKESLKRYHFFGKGRRAPIAIIPALVVNKIDAACLKVELIGKSGEKCTFQCPENILGLITEETKRGTPFSILVDTDPYQDNYSIAGVVTEKKP
jgi:hypothetical protein